MMRLLLFFCFVGVAAYALLPSPQEPDWNTDATIAAAPEQADSSDRKLRSWGPTLKALGQDPRQAALSAPLRQEAAYRPGIAEEPSGSDQTLSADDVAAAQVAAPIPTVDSAGEHVARVKLILAARVHSAASVSSPVIKIYGAGRELEVVGREYGWLELRDPVTLERGFVFESYVVAIDGPSPTRSALESTAEAEPARVSSPKPAMRVSGGKPAMRVSGGKPTMQAADDTEAPRLDRRRLAKKEERRERKLFRWFGGRDAALAPMTVGSPR
jgi:hypothetical protein